MSKEWEAAAPPGEFRLFIPAEEIPLNKFLADLPRATAPSTLTTEVGSIRGPRILLTEPRKRSQPKPRLP